MISGSPVILKGEVTPELPHLAKGREVLGCRLSAAMGLSGD